MKQRHFPVGMRTLKSALAVMAALFVVEQYGATASKMIFALIGALSTMEPTFKGAIRNCVAQICGVVFGVLFGVAMLQLPINYIYIIGIGIVLIITFYNLLHLTISPSLPCIVLVTVCTAADLQPVTYALGRLWDTAIGLSIGLVVNMLIFPYNNSRKIRAAIKSLDHDLVDFLEEFFDGDEHLPDAEIMRKKIRDIDAQLSIFADQRLLRWKKQKRELHSLQQCDEMATRLVTELEALSNLDRAGHLSGVIKQRLVNSGARVMDDRVVTYPDELDIITNYHVGRVLSLRRKLREALNEVTK